MSTASPQIPTGSGVQASKSLPTFSNDPCSPAIEDPSRLPTATSRPTFLRRQAPYDRKGSLHFQTIALDILVAETESVVVEGTGLPEVKGGGTDGTLNQQSLENRHLLSMQVEEKSWIRNDPKPWLPWAAALERMVLARPGDTGVSGRALMTKVGLVR